MNTAEFPPKDGDTENNSETVQHEEVERYEAEPIEKSEEEKIRAEEQQFHSEHAADKEMELQRAALRDSIGSAVFKLQNQPAEKQSFEAVTAVSEPGAPIKKMPWYRKAMTAAAFGLASLFAGGAQGATGEGKTGNENKKVSTEKTVTATPQKKPSGISFYAGGTEKTPTGKDNAFSTNMDALSEGDLIAMAEKFGLPTTSNIEFQKALLEKYPTEVQAVMEEYGQTNAGTFTDGVLGARVKKVLEKIQQRNEPTTPQITTPTAPSPAPEGNSSKKIERVPIANYLINVRGDEKNGDGAYYFFETEEALREALSALRTVDANPKSVEFRGKKYGQASFDMNASVFDTYYAKTPEIKALLGEKMTRDPENPNFFIPKN